MGTLLRQVILERGEPWNLEGRTIAEDHHFHVGQFGDSFKCFSGAFEPVDMMGMGVVSSYMHTHDLECHYLRLKSYVDFHNSLDVVRRIFHSVFGKSMLKGRLGNSVERIVDT